MSDDNEAGRLAENAARQQREADLVKNRIEELYEQPVKGDFDAAHLKAVHAHIFQDLPEHNPGIVRPPTGDGWIKDRVLEGHSSSYVVHYAGADIEPKITNILDQFGGAEAIKGLTSEAAAGRLAKLYGDLDHAHGFSEGNSRTLREFTREIAKEAGFNLDWTPTAVGQHERNELYMARDLAVMERAFPDLTAAKARQTNDRVEHEASFVIEALRNDVGDRPLEAIIRQGLSVEHQLERGTQNEQLNHKEGARNLGNAAANGSVGIAAETLTSADQSATIGHAIAAGVDKIADGFASFAERGLDTILSFLGGGTSAPEPAHEQSPPPAQTHAERVKGYIEAERRQHTARLQEDARKLGTGEAITDEELRRREMDAQKESRDRGGGISR
jgi:fido (protein-threonine AMPylation protein)